MNLALNACGQTLIGNRCRKQQIIEFWLNLIFIVRYFIDHIIWAILYGVYSLSVLGSVLGPIIFQTGPKRAVWTTSRAVIWFGFSKIKKCRNVSYFDLKIVYFRLNWVSFSQNTKLMLTNPYSDDSRWTGKQFITFDQIKSSPN